MELPERTGDFGVLDHLAVAGYALLWRAGVVALDQVDRARQVAAGVPAAAHPLIDVVHAQLGPAHDELAGGRIAGRREPGEHAELGRRPAGRFAGSSCG